ncbi:MAG: acetylornithine/succinylornithine family transaminase [Calditrichaeota bacterium]|nr:MAG: acetylornithine/succinylornithine family transaminase [Calditrichota bacterium]
MSDYIRLEKRYSFDVYPKRELVLVKGRGAMVWDAEGKAYLDCVGGHGVANLGHANERVLAALNAQAEQLITCSNLFYNDRRALLLEKLVSISPESLTRAFLCNSGAESIEAAIKFARFTTGRTDFVCADMGFHGRTLGALSATYKSEYREAFQPLVPGFSFAQFNDAESFSALVTDKTAGVILEVVQGEGGIRVARPEFLRHLRDLCDRTGALLIIDEIQSGFCRTGRMFACEHFDLQPDILCVAKAIAGGLPMGAVVCSQKVKVPVGKHGTTFGGNPLCCAAALAAIDFMLEKRLAAQAEEKGEYLLAQLRRARLAQVKEIRHLGLMIGIELTGPAQPAIMRLMEAGVLVFPAGKSVLRVFPPLVVTYAELDFLAEKLIECLG